MGFSVRRHRGGGPSGPGGPDASSAGGGRSASSAAGGARDATGTGASSAGGGRSASSAAGGADDRRARRGGAPGFSARPALGAALERGPEVGITIDGRPVRAHLGESVAAVLIAEGPAALRRTRGGDPRGVFCGMGVCFDCLAVVDGVPNTRTCMTWVTEGMTVQRQAGFGPADR